jgi:hypothetical protein
MFVGTFVLVPVLKTHLEQEHRHKFIVNFIPRVRSFVRIFVGLLIVTGILQLVIILFTREGPADTARLGVLLVKLLFAALPIAIFLLAPKILGKTSKEGLCCDPDAEDTPVYIAGVMTSTGSLLHYIAIAGGWLAVLCAIILTHMD